MYTEKDLNFRNELYFSFDHYTKFSDPDKIHTLDNINKRFLKAKELLFQPGILILTLGTSYIFELKKTGEIVNNCHKIPASEFNRRILSVEEIIIKFHKFIEKIKPLNPDIKIIFTVSPVRHLKDGLIENQLSKSTLLLTIKKLIESFPDLCTYFPAYEIMMDDLRDYRYYNSDLVHPNDQAVDYIWDQFSNTYFGKRENEILPQIDKLFKAISHRPLHTNTNSFLKFKEFTEEKIKKLKREFPFLNWSELGNY